MAVDQVCSAAACPVVFNTFDECGFDFRVIGEAEIVITAKADDFSAIDDHLGLLRPVTDTAFAIKVLRLALS